MVVVVVIGGENLLVWRERRSYRGDHEVATEVSMIMVEMVREEVLSSSYNIGLLVNHWPHRLLFLLL